MHVQPSSPQPESQALAAGDLGSNSFHLLVVRPNDGELQVLDRLKARVARVGPGKKLAEQHDRFTP